MFKKCNYHCIVSFAGFVLLLSVFFSTSVFAQPEINILPSSHRASSGHKINAIHQIIRSTFDVADDNSPYYKVKAKVIYGKNGFPVHLVVYLLSKDTYAFETVRINLGKDYRVKAVLRNYDEQPEDQTPDSVKTNYASCPDDTVDMVFATCETGIATAVSCVENLAYMAEAMGYKVVELYGEDENIEAYEDWLSCDGLKLFGRVGHGSTTGIMLDDGTLSYTYFEELSSTALEDKVLFFNSCQVHNSPLEPAIVGAGVQKYIGGITNLYIGPSERVFQCWFEDVVNGAAITSTIEDCNSAIPSAGTFGISGNGSDYLTSGPSPEPEGKELINGQTVSNLSGDRGSWQHYWINVPDSVSSLTVKMSGGTGDADLYVRYGAVPTTTTYDCRPYNADNDETCEFSNPNTGLWYIGIRGYRDFSDVSLIATH
ncbi:MAG: hypothetical protein GY874_19340 [Desulfobacteraceae bacterium]|nr:hypothetical protein [Desulfobacteraceae bacterium]